MYIHIFYHVSTNTSCWSKQTNTSPHLTTPLLPDPNTPMPGLVPGVQQALQGSTAPLYA